MIDPVLILVMILDSEEVLRKKVDTFDETAKSPAVRELFCANPSMMVIFELRSTLQQKFSTGLLAGSFVKISWQSGDFGDEGR